MAKKTVAAKKRVVKVDAMGQLHVHSSFNNIIVSLANSEGQLISYLFCWQDGFPWLKEEYSLRCSDGSTGLCQDGV